MLNIRLAVFLPLFVLLVPRPADGRAARAAFVVAGLSSLLAATHATLAIRACARELGGFDEALAAIRPGTKVLSLEFDRDSDVSYFPPWIHIAALHRVRVGGVAAISFAGLSHWPVRYRDDAAPPAHARRFWEFHPCLYRNTLDGPYYDYVLVRGDVDPFAANPPGPRFERVLRTDRWTLFAKTGDVVAVTPGIVDDGPCQGKDDK